MKITLLIIYLVVISISGILMLMSPLLNYLKYKYDWSDGFNTWIPYYVGLGLFLCALPLMLIAFST